VSASGTASFTPATAGTMPRSLWRDTAQVPRVMRLYWLQSPSSMIFMAFDAIILPALIFYFGVRITRGDVDMLNRYLAGGVATGLGIGATTKVGFSVLSDIQLKRLPLIRSLGVPKLGYLGAHIGTALCFALLSAAASSTLLQLTGFAVLRGASLWPLSIAALASGAAMGALGAAIATVARDYASGHAWLSIASLGLAFLSPVFYDIAALPWPIAWLSWLSPFTHTAVLVNAVIADGAVPVPHLLALVALAAVLNFVVWRALAWT
jgi:ABC-type polysaccharide/polyol phosphate export permease